MITWGAKNVHMHPTKVRFARIILRQTHIPSRSRCHILYSLTGKCLSRQSGIFSLLEIVEKKDSASVKTTQRKQGSWNILRKLLISNMAWSSSNCKYYSYFLSYKKKLLPGQSNHAGDFFFLLLARQNIPNHYLTVKMCLKRFRPKSIFKPFTRINVGKVFLFHFFFQLYFSLSSGFQLQTLAVPCLWSG